MLPGAGRGNGELVFQGNRVSVWEMKKFWTWMGVMVARQCERPLTPLNCTLSNG